MKKILIAGIIAVAVAAVAGFGSYKYITRREIINSKHQNQKIKMPDKTTQVTVKESTKQVTIPIALASQGKIGTTVINNENFKTITVGNAQNNNQTIAIFPNIGNELTINKDFTKATNGENQVISQGSTSFDVTYNGSNGWEISYNGQSYSDAKRFTTEYIPKIIKTSQTTGYLYAPASSATNQGFLIEYNLKHNNVFNWFLTINNQGTSLPRTNALGLGNLMLNDNFGFYANPSGAIYIFNNTYTMLLQSAQYPSMKFIFNTGAKNNIEPLENMGYFDDSLTKKNHVNNNIPMIYPINSTKGYIYQKPTADSDGYIWFFNTNWNNGYSLNENGVAISAGNYNTPVYNANSNTVTVAASVNIKGVTAVPSTDFNGNYVNYEDTTGTTIPVHHDIEKIHKSTIKPIIHHKISQSNFKPVSWMQFDTIAKAIGCTAGFDSFNCQYGEFLYNVTKEPGAPSVSIWFDANSSLSNTELQDLKPAFDVIVPGAWNFIMTNLNNSTTTQAVFDGYSVTVFNGTVVIV